MKTHSTIAGNPYVVYSKDGCTVTDSTGTLNKVVPAGDFLTLPAPSDALITSDDNALVRKANFKYAALALRLLGGGDNLLPSGYTRLEYLEGTGTQHINTGMPCSDKTEVRAVAMVAPYAGATRYHRLFGSAASGDVPRLSLTLTLYEARMSFGSRFGSVSRSFNTGLTNADLEASAFEYFVSAASAGVVGKNEQTNVLDAEWQCSAQTQLFCWGSGGGMEGRVYSFTMKEAGALKLNLIPALDETGAPCMFDTVSRKPFYNAGTGDFVTPSTGAYTYSLRGRRMLPDWGKLTENGLRRLYHAPAGYKGDAYDYALENGYKPIVEEPAPDVGYWMPKWHDREDCIELEWVETEPPAEELLTEA